MDPSRYIKVITMLYRDITWIDREQGRPLYQDRDRVASATQMQLHYGIV